MDRAITPPRKTSSSTTDKELKIIMDETNITQVSEKPPAMTEIKKLKEPVKQQLLDKVYHPP